MIRSTLVEFLEETFLFEFDQQITEESDLFKEGIMDSFGYIKLMKFIKETYRINLSREEILTDVISTLSGMVSLIDSKTNLDS